jgi:hypothetical protein
MAEPAAGVYDGAEFLTGFLSEGDDMRPSSWGATLALLFGAAVALAGDGLKSGPQPGDRTGAFDVQDVTGPNKGKTLCYV